MKGEIIKSKEEAVQRFKDFAERTNWFDNEIARENALIFIEEVWNDATEKSINP